MSGLALRVIPCLDLDGGRVMKGRRFEGLRDLGDPLALARRYEEEGADEIALLDISATLEARSTALESLRSLREVLGIPILMGGGLRTEEDAARILDAGADRVALNSAAVADPSIIDRLSARFGAQCVVLAIDARRRAGREGDPPAWEVVVEAGRRAVSREPAGWAREAGERGAGEILLTSIDRDGGGEGYDLGLLAAVSRATALPLVASGGAARPAHFLAGLRAGATALLAAGVFHRGELAVGELKRYLKSEGMEVRT
jgi:cyclase